MQELGAGFNLGNTFDVKSNSTRLASLQNLIALYQKAGMRHVRIPVTWGAGFGGDTLADSGGNLKTRHPRLKDLTLVVDHALAQGLFVIVNTHHESWLKERYDGSPNFDRVFARLWQGIAKHFASRSSRLLFEVLNEPEKAFGDWSGKRNPYEAQAVAWTRRINEVGYRAIRETGGSNVNRWVIVMPNGQGNQHTLSTVYPGRSVLPGKGQDRFVGVSVHTYDPWEFCGQDGKNAAWPGEKEIQKPLKAIAAHAKKLGVPVNYGEFGVGREKTPQDRNTPVVRTYYRTVCQTALRLGMSATPWDDQGWFGLVTRGAGDSYRFLYEIVPSMLAKE